MSIPFNYSIIKVDEAARVMEVVYTSPGRQPVHVGARLPYQGEDLEGLIRAYSPVAYWLEQDAIVVPPTVGTEGSIDAPPEESTLEGVKFVKRDQIAKWRYAQETRGVVYQGVAVATDRTTQAQIASTFLSLKEGLLATVDWKSLDGTFHTLDFPAFAALAVAVAQHVQSAFTDEKGLLAQVAAAQTKEDVLAIALPAVQPINSIPATVL